jgi:hypothetical protein
MALTGTSRYNLCAVDGLFAASRANLDITPYQPSYVRVGGNPGTTLDIADYSDNRGSTFRVRVSEFATEGSISQFSARHSKVPSRK